MANAEYDYQELRFRILPHWTEVFVLLSPASDGTLGVQGWHAKRFPPAMSVNAILERMFGTDGKGESDAPVLWPQEAPQE